MTNNNFIKSVEFLKGEKGEENLFPPFKGGDKIYFGGEKEVQNLIEFYLKSKPENKDKSKEEIRRNAERFKINCVLGNNGGGKSRLFEKILGLEDILNYTSERKNKYWDFYDLGIMFQKTQSYYLKNSNNSLNICNTKSKVVLTDLSTKEEIKKTLSSILKKDLKKGDLTKLIEQDTENKIKNVVPEEDYLKNIGENSKEIIKFSNILDKNGKIREFNFILDDFFKLSGNIKYSVNNELLNEKKYNKFYCNLFNDIGKFKDIYSGFLNIGNNFETIISFDFKDWKDNYKGNYFDFLNFHEDYNEEIDKNNVKDELDGEYENILDFFIILNDIYLEKNNILKKFGITKKEAKEIWLYLSEIFLVMVNYFDRYMSIDDKFIKEMLLGKKRFGSGEQDGFKEKGLFAYENYFNYKAALNLLKIYLEINLELLEKNIFDRKYLKEKDTIKKIKFMIENISFNLKQLLKNLEYIENDVHDIAKQGYIVNKKQKYFFKNIKGEKVSYNDFIDKIQGSKYSSQSKYLLINLLFGYSDINYYTKIDNPDIYKDFIGNNELEENQNLIRDLSYYFFDGPIYSFEKIGEESFSYSGEEKLLKSEIEFISNKFVNCDINFKDNISNINKSFDNLSAGEKMTLTRFTNIFRYIFENKQQNNFIILIDEPDLHLHLDWQKKYIQKLIDVFSTLDTDIKLHFIIATHSPFIISDLPAESLIVLDGSEKNKYGGEFTEIIDDYEKKYGRKTFGANFVDLINDGFFFENKVLMGSFAESVIGEIAENKRREIMTNKEIKKDKKLVEDIEKQIGDDFLKDNLLYFKSKNNN